MVESSTRSRSHHSTGTGRPACSSSRMRCRRTRDVAVSPWPPGTTALSLFSAARASSRHFALICAAGTAAANRCDSSDPANASRSTSPSPGDVRSTADSAAETRSAISAPSLTRSARRSSASSPEEAKALIRTAPGRLTNRPNSASIRAGSAVPSMPAVALRASRPKAGAHLQGRATSDGRNNPDGSQPRPSLEVSRITGPPSVRNTATAQSRPWAVSATALRVAASRVRASSRSSSSRSPTTSDGKAFLALSGWTAAASGPVARG